MALSQLWSGSANGWLRISATVVVMAISALGASMGWSIQPQRVRLVTQAVTHADGTVVQEPKLDACGKPATELIPSGAPVTPRNLLSVDGVYWLLANAVRNFINFAPLGVVLVGMFGIGVAEKVGLFGAGMRWVAGIVPSRALTPTIVFLGVMSNIASDAGYIVLPPLAAALYAAFGRSPLAGIAAAFAGVSAGFSANLMSPIARPDFLPFLQGRGLEMGRLIGVTYGEGFTTVRPPALKDLMDLG